MAPGCLCGPVSLSLTKQVSVYPSASLLRETDNTASLDFSFLGRVCQSPGHYVLPEFHVTLNKLLRVAPWKCCPSGFKCGQHEILSDPQLPPKKWSFLPLNLRFSITSLPGPAYVIQHLPWDTEELTTCCLGFCLLETLRNGQGWGKTSMKVPF